LIAQARAAFCPSYGNTAAELALGDHLAFAVETNLAGHREHIASAHKRHVIGDRRFWLRKRDAKFPHFLLHRSGHGPSFRLIRDVCLRRSLQAVQDTMPAAAKSCPACGEGRTVADDW
jgi:hypothetical protein